MCGIMGLDVYRWLVIFIRLIDIKRHRNRWPNDVRIDGRKIWVSSFANGNFCF